MKVEVLCWGVVAQMVRNLPEIQECWGQVLDREDRLEKEMATHSRIPAWRILRTEEPGRLESMGHDWLTDTFPFKLREPLEGALRDRGPLQPQGSSLPCGDPKCQHPRLGEVPVDPLLSHGLPSPHSQHTLPVNSSHSSCPPSCSLFREAGWALAPAPKAGVWGGESSNAACNHSSPKVSESDTPHHHEAWFPVKCVHPAQHYKSVLIRYLYFSLQHIFQVAPSYPKEIFSPSCPETHP